MLVLFGGCQISTRTHISPGSREAALSPCFPKDPISHKEFRPSGGEILRFPPGPHLIANFDVHISFPPNNTNQHPKTTMAYYPLTPLFHPGNVITSPVVIDHGIEIQKLLSRHTAGRWGEDIDPNELAANMEALEAGDTILSHYSVCCAEGVVRTVILITAACRSWTLIFIPGEGGFPLAPENR